MASPQPLTVLRRLLDDDDIHAHLAEAGAGLSGAYRRARRLPADKAAQDKTLYEHVRQAVAGLTAATRQTVAKPEPAPRRGRFALAALVLVPTAAVVAWAARADRAGRAPAPRQSPAPGRAAPVTEPTIADAPAGGGS
jgi:hypothetical protein